MRQVELFRWGGKRKGAGRKAQGDRAGTSHKARPAIKASHPMHVTIRVASDIRTLRSPEVYAAVRAASAGTAERREQFRINHLSIQRTHLHAIVEAENKLELARGMQSFLISAARRINAVFARHGKVFTDRYHLVVITSPRQMRSVLAYVFGNYKKHGERDVPAGWMVDPYATGWAFDGWREVGVQLWPSTADLRNAVVVKPAQSWMLREGWKRSGELISVSEQPGRRPE